mmetsp:Transcript_50886/g.111443  ORF Transcript_50886/g.111443 Transcript_50886/m.111443 type:complete len:240 (-) Transcript_50886:795-1514(-)
MGAQHGAHRGKFDLFAEIASPLLGDMQGILVERQVSELDGLGSQGDGGIGGVESCPHREGLLSVQVLAQRQLRGALRSLALDIVRQHTLHLGDTPAATNDLNLINVPHAEAGNLERFLHGLNELVEHRLAPLLKLRPCNLLSEISVFKQPFDRKSCVLVGTQDVLGLLGSSKDLLECSFALPDSGLALVLIHKRIQHLVGDLQVREEPSCSVGGSAAEGLDHGHRNSGGALLPMIPHDT